MASLTHYTVVDVPMAAVGNKDGGHPNVKCEAHDDCHALDNKGTHTGEAKAVATYLSNGHR